MLQGRWGVGIRDWGLRIRAGVGTNYQLPLTNVQTRLIASLTTNNYGNYRFTFRNFWNWNRRRLVGDSQLVLYLPT
ncbi:asr4527 [Nostoc sp. PCC 7120 = FACHB-418]|nr:asr4527 [Nostoc sp. PCC 7120 = FACHB-418]